MWPFLGCPEQDLLYLLLPSMLLLLGLQEWSSVDWPLKTPTVSLAFMSCSQEQCSLGCVVPVYITYLSSHPSTSERLVKFEILEFRWSFASHGQPVYISTCSHGWAQAHLVLIRYKPSALSACLHAFPPCESELLPKKNANALYFLTNAVNQKLW